MDDRKTESEFEATGARLDCILCARGFRVVEKETVFRGCWVRWSDGVVRICLAMEFGYPGVTIEFQPEAYPRFAIPCSVAWELLDGIARPDGMATPDEIEFVERHLDEVQRLLLAENVADTKQRYDAIIKRRWRERRGGTRQT